MSYSFDTRTAFHLFVEEFWLCWPGQKANGPAPSWDDWVALSEEKKDAVESKLRMAWQAYGGWSSWTTEIGHAVWYTA